MPKYHTRQREQLLEFFGKNTDKSLSAVQIAESIKDISISAIDRNLAAREREGALKRVPKSGTREVYYQYIGSPECRGSIHVSCTGCGKTYHLPHDTAKKLEESLKTSDGFKISCGDTVLYGVCAECNKERDKK